jgi:hypothetical protein
MEVTEVAMEVTEVAMEVKAVKEVAGAVKKWFNLRKNRTCSMHHVTLWSKINKIEILMKSMKFLLF